MFGMTLLSHRIPFLLAIGTLYSLNACSTGHENYAFLPHPLPSETVIVTLDTWHAMLAFPVQSHQNSPNDEQVYEEWGYAEREWYVEGEQGISGTFRALFWPTEGVVEVGHHPTIWADRTPNPPADVYVFQLTPEQMRVLRKFLVSSIDSSTPVADSGGFTFYPAVQPYHLFHTCHQYAARALEAAGLSLTPSLAFHSSILGWQLDDLPQRLRFASGRRVGDGSDQALSPDEADPSPHVHQAEE